MPEIGIARSMRRPAMTRRFAIIAALLLAPAHVFAQRGDDTEKTLAPTYVSERLAAYEELAKARKFADDGNPDRAVDIYQGMVDRLGDSLLAAPAPATSRPVEAGLERFVGVAEVVFAEVMARPELVQAYRLRYETSARAAIRTAPARPGSVSRAAERYFPSSAAAASLETTADDWREAGQFGAARRVFDRLLGLHPDRERRGWEWKAKRALCDAWLGDDAALTALMAELARAADPPNVEWAGKRQPLEAFLRNARPNPGRIARTAASAAPAAVFGGDPTKQKLVESDIRAEARLWRFTEFHPSTALALPGEDTPDERIEEALRRALASGRQLGLLPVACEERLFVCDRRSVWAIDAQGGDAPLWRFWSGPGPRENADNEWGGEEESPALYTLAVANGAVYAPLEPGAPRVFDDRGGSSSLLVCLDADTGRLRWSRDMQELGNKFDEYHMDGAPLIAGSKLLCIIRQRKPFGFEACYLVACDAADGHVLWQTHLGEAATGGYGYHRATRAFPALAGERVFVNTNIGTVAAVDVTDGRIAWLWRYTGQSSEGASDATPARPPQESVPWSYNPAMVWRDRFLAAPPDANEVFVFEAANGRVAARIALDALRSPVSILGIVGDRLLAVGRWLVCFDLAAGKVEWERQLPAGRLFGRGAVTARSVFVPTDVALLRYPVDGGAPQSYGWTLRNAGNVVPAADQIVIAGGNSLAGLVQKEAALRRLDARLKADTADPLPALAIAELAFETRDHVRGLSAIDEAVRRAGGGGRVSDDALRARLFRHCLRYAESLLKSAEKPPDDMTSLVDAALHLLDHAAVFAPDSPARVRYRLVRADVLLAARRPAEAILTYQQILLDAGLARLRVPADTTGDTAAGALARDRIARLIRENGREVYAEVERRAAEKLQVALASGDQSALANVAERYPNSAAAPQALVRRAALQEADGHATDAVRSLHRALGFGDTVDRSLVYRRLAVILAGAGRYGTARQWLERGVREFPSVRFDHAGRNMGFAELATALLGSAADRPGPGPRLTLPLSNGLTRDFPSAVAVLEPAHPRDDAVWDALVTFCENRVDCIDAISGAPRWTKPLDIRGRPTLLTFDARVAVLATRHQIFGIAPDSGKIVWTFGENRDDAQDWESVAQWTVHTVSPTQIISATDKGDLIALRIADGHEEWRVRTDPKVSTRLVADDRWVAYVAWEERQNTVVVRDAANGRQARTIHIGAERPIQFLALTDDGRLLAVSATSVHAIEPETGTVIWNNQFEGRIALASICVGADRLFLSSDGARLGAFDLLAGRLLWNTPALTGNSDDTLRAELCGNAVVVCTPHSVSGIDALGGALLWERPIIEPVDLLPPIALDSVVVVASRPPASASQPASAPAAGIDIRVLDLATGDEQAVIASRRENAAPAASRPAAAPQRLHVDAADGIIIRERSLIVRTGAKLIGFTGPIAAERGSQ